MLEIWAYCVWSRWHHGGALPPTQLPASWAPATKPKKELMIPDRFHRTRSLHRPRRLTLFIALYFVREIAPIESPSNGRVLCLIRPRGQGQADERRGKDGGFQGASHRLLSCYSLT